MQRSMRPFLLPLCGAALLASSACGKKADVNSRLSELEKAFRAPAAGTTVQIERPGSSRAPLADANAYVNLALLAVRTNDRAGRVNAMTPPARSFVRTAKRPRVTYAFGPANGARREPRLSILPGGPS